MIFRAEDARGGPPVAIKTVRSAREEDAAIDTSSGRTRERVKRAA